MKNAEVDEEAVAFVCGPLHLWGVFSPAVEVNAASTAVLIVVGGPQYRVGSHRQFVLLARSLASAGFPTLRFDYSGMGDSEGEMRDFRAVGPDIQSALDALAAKCPGFERFVVWGLCDAASAALMYAVTDPRVVGVVAANPWVRSDASLAKTHIRHYYLSRLGQREFWVKLLRGGIHWGAALQSFAISLGKAIQGARSAGVASSNQSFQDRMAKGLAQFSGRVLLILSGNDMTAKEFVQFANTDPSWRGLLDAAMVTRHDVAEADHTFSRRKWLNEVEERTIDWLTYIGQPRLPTDVHS